MNTAAPQSQYASFFNKFLMVSDDGLLLGLAATEFRTRMVRSAGPFWNSATAVSVFAAR